MTVPSVAQRDAAKLFSTALFRPLMSGRSSARADSLVASLRSKLNISDSVTNFTVVGAAYDALRRTYRSEYYYKNLITSNIFIGRHRASKSTLLNEFHIGGSIADCVLINGKAVVYEIKTEFDSPEKLESQMKSYYRGFPYVNIVVHAAHIQRYHQALDDSPAGLIAVGPQGHLSPVKPAQRELKYLHLQSMFNSLRIEEIRGLLTRRFGRLPEVPNGIRYSTYLEIADSIPPREFQFEMQSALKARSLKNGRELLFSRKLLPLRALLAQLDPNDRERHNLLSWLESRAS